MKEKYQMNNVNWLYRIAFLFILIAIIAGQLIWLPAPLFNQASIEWISLINGLYYALLIIPICFMLATTMLLYKRHKQHNIKHWQRLLCSLMLIMSSYNCVVIIAKNYLAAIIGLAVITACGFVLYIETNVSYRLVRRKRLVMSTATYILILLLLICPIPYNVTYPFFTFNVEQYATIKQVENKQLSSGNNKKGEIDGVLVADRPAFIVDILYSKLFKHIDIEKRLKTDLPVTKLYSQVVSQKHSSNQIATAYAWQYYSGEATIHLSGVKIVGVLEESAVRDSLVAGDIITSLNHKQVATTADLASIMKDIKVGEQIELSVIHNVDEHKNVTVRPLQAVDNPDKAVLGIYIEQAITVDDSPLAVSYKDYIAHFGGPSHGAMLTLSLLNQLNEGQLVGQLHVAGTGTIEADGSIGMVGGIKQKAYAVSRSDAEVFFVPEQAVEIAKQGAPNLNIVGVKHFDDIVVWLKQHQ